MSCLQRWQGWWAGACHRQPGLLCQALEGGEEEVRKRTIGNDQTVSMSFSALKRKSENDERLKPVNDWPNDQAGQLHEDCEDGEADPNHPHRLPLPLLHEQLEHSREKADGIGSHQGSHAVHARKGKEEEDPCANCVQCLKEQDKGKLEDRRSLVRLEERLDMG